MTYLRVEKPEPQIIHDIIDISSRIVLVDTNVILDFLEKRNREVSNFIKYLIKLSGKQLVTVGTTIYNIAEVLDKELEIRFQLELLKNRLSSDDIIRTVRNRWQYPTNIEKLNDDSKRKLFGSVNRNISRLLQDFVIFLVSDFTEEDYEILEELILNGYLQSQDALMVLTAFKLNAFLVTKDNYLLDSPIVNSLVFIYDPSNVDHRRELLKEITGGE